jgi:formiminotetrahydrofolate cyclodeaminase
MLDLVETRTEPYAGGSSAAIAAAFAAALVTMTARISTDWDAAPGIAAQARALRHRLLELAADDAEAFADAVAALETGTERGRRPLGVVLARAADVPLAIASAAADVAELAAIATTGARPAVRPDAVAAAALAEAACFAAAHLVDVNLATLPGDERRAAAAAARVAATDARSRAMHADG